MSDRAVRGRGNDAAHGFQEGSNDEERPGMQRSTAFSCELRASREKCVIGNGRARGLHASFVASEARTDGKISASSYARFSQLEVKTEEMALTKIRRAELRCPPRGGGRWPTGPTDPQAVARTLPCPRSCRPALPTAGAAGAAAPPVSCGVSTVGGGRERERERRERERERERERKRERYKSNKIVFQPNVRRGQLRCRKEKQGRDDGSKTC